MQQIERLIIGGGSDVDAADITRLRALVQEFETELATLGARVDDVEGRVEFLEDHQFSTTTKLEGKVVFAAIGAEGGAADDDQITFGNRVRLNLDTSFTGQDNLRVRLAAANAVRPNIGTAEGGLAFADDASGGNNVEVDALVYAFPLTKRLNVAIAANAGASDDFASTINFLDGDGNEGALTNFGTRNPIYYQIEDKGIGLEYSLSDKIILSAGYMAPDANNPSEKAGLFNGAYGALGQLHFIPSDNLEFGLTYLNSYNLSDTGTGSNNSNVRALTNNELPTSSNSYGVEASWKIGDKFVLGGWAGYSNIRALSSLGGRVDRGSFDVWNWAVTAAFPDFLADGALGGIVVGIEPKVTNSSVVVDGNNLEDPDTSLHVEAFYQYPLNDNIMITPGIVWLTAPDHNSSNDDVFIATIRTLFSF
ncbi:MAG: iron uptake porin [Limnothrix sp.]